MKTTRRIIWYSTVAIVALLMATIVSAANITMQGSGNNVAPTVGAVTITPSGTITPGTTFYVAANVDDSNGLSDIMAINVSCVGTGGTEWTDSWDSLKLLNTSYISWTAVNSTAYLVNGTFDTTINYWSLKSVGGDWTCKIYVNDSAAASSVSSTTMTVDTSVGIAIAESNCVFDTGNPGDADKQWKCPSDGTRNETITHNGNVDIDVKVAGTDLTGQSDASWKIGVGNITWNATYAPNGGILPGTVLTGSATSITTSWSRGSSPTSAITNITTWLDYPTPLKNQAYQGTITITSLAS